MQNKMLDIFKIEYYWCEGEHGETLLVKEIERKEFEKDLIEAKKFAESLMGKKIKEGNYLGEGYSIECLPEYYEQIIWFLINKKNYTECHLDDNISYQIGDEIDKKIELTKSEKDIKHTIIK